MQHLTHNQCLDLHIQHRDYPELIDLLVRYEWALSQIADYEKETEELMEMHQRVTELEQQVRDLTTQNDVLMTDLDEQDKIISTLEKALTIDVTVKEVAA